MSRLQCDWKKSTQQNLEFLSLFRQKREDVCWCTTEIFRAKIPCSVAFRSLLSQVLKLTITYIICWICQKRSKNPSLLDIPCTLYKQFGYKHFGFEINFQKVSHIRTFQSIKSIIICLQHEVILLVTIILQSLVSLLIIQ